ncbi:MAG: histidine kinase N-terminal 7TM domain-containing protein [Haloarculaceae archaeon]
MPGEFLGYVALFGVETVVGASVLAVTWRQRDRPGGLYAVLFMAAVTIWTASDLFNALAGPLWLKHAFGLLTYVGVEFVVPGWLLYVLVFTGNEQWISRRTLAVLFGFPALYCLAVLTDPIHGLMFEATYVHQPSHTLMSYPSPAFFPSFLFSTTLGIASTYLLVKEFVVTHRYYRRQVGALLLAEFAAWITVGLFMAKVVRFDITPLGYLVGGVAMWWAITRAGLMDIVPVARDMVVESVDAGIVVVDDRGQVVDCNPQALALLGVESGVVGSDLREGVADDDIADALETLLGTDREASHTVEADDRILDVDVTPLTDRRDEFVGQVLMFTDVTEKHRRLRELRRQNDQLEEFASLVSHDLRNPLNVAAGRAEILEHSDDPEHLTELQSALGRMDDIIDDVLTLAREGRSIDETAPVDLDDLARSAWSHVDTGEATLVAESDVTIDADRDRLLRVLENLFRNALDHGPADATVRVGALDGGFFVADDGPGIPPENREQVFESGYTSHPEGTGFGLAIVRSIVEAHGWEVSVTDSESGGARFEVRGVRVPGAGPALATADGGPAAGGE